ncbi:MAG: rhamnose ABC transporter substrate-binding protein [Treponema sp.]|jgi:rhamnose transport system substrate-binding protein|nr:rhamnose ABC transporter substrate-binding protein [Treponema sp.]
MKKVIALSLILCLVCAVAVFARGAQSGGSERHAIIFKNTGNPYGERQMGGFEDGIKEQGFEAILRAPDLPTAEAQITMIDQLVAQRVTSICIVGNDYDALQPALTRAMNAGIKIYSLDSSVNPRSRATHVNQADTQKIGETLVEAAFDMAGGSGEIAILSATSQASNQNAWIAVMQEVLKQPKYANLNLVRIAYGDDLRDKSTTETQGLLASFPNLKVIVAPTTVGIAAASKVVTDQNLVGRIKVTGLGLPSEMADYITNGSCPYMFLWNPIDVGYLGAYVATALTKGTITGKVGDRFSAGRLGQYTITAAPDGGTEVLLGPPFKFEPSNINTWKSVY